MKVYRRHNCTAAHRSARTFMKCAIPKAAWIVGRGDYASIAWCDVPTVELYATGRTLNGQRRRLIAPVAGALPTPS